MSPELVDRSSQRTQPATKLAIRRQNKIIRLEGDEFQLPRRCTKPKPMQGLTTTG